MSFSFACSNPDSKPACHPRAEKELVYPFHNCCTLRCKAGGLVGQLPQVLHRLMLLYPLPVCQLLVPPLLVSLLLIPPLLVLPYPLLPPVFRRLLPLLQLLPLRLLLL